MNKELNMIGSTKEDLEMMAIIEENHLRVRKDNIKKSKKDKRDELIAKIVVGFGSVVGTLGLMYLIALVESLKF